MATVGIAGKLLRVKFGDKYIKCQADATLNFTNNFDEDGGCKPTGDELVGEGSWIERVIDTQDWSVTVSARVFLDALAGSELTQADIIALNIAGNIDGEIEFLTTTGQHNQPNDIIITGPVVISSIALNAPYQGKATTDYEFQGNGQPTQSVIPVTT